MIQHKSPSDCVSDGYVSPWATAWGLISPRSVSSQHPRRRRHRRPIKAQVRKGMNRRWNMQCGCGCERAGIQSDPVLACFFSLSPTKHPATSTRQLGAGTTSRVIYLSIRLLCRTSAKTTYLREVRRSVRQHACCGEALGQPAAKADRMDWVRYISWKCALRSALLFGWVNDWAQGDVICMLNCGGLFLLV